MATLKLRKEMFPAIYSGKKTSTSRQGIRDFKPGTNLTIVAQEDELTSIDVLITDVTHCKFNELNEEEAIREGYGSLKEMKETLEKIYDISKDDNFTLIEFSLRK